MHLFWLKTERELLPHWRSPLNAKSNRKRKLHGNVIFSIHRKTMRRTHILQDPKASFLLLFFRFCTAWFLAPSCCLDTCMGNWGRYHEAFQPVLSTCLIAEILGLWYQELFFIHGEKGRIYPKSLLINTAW